MKRIFIILSLGLIGCVSAPISKPKVEQDYACYIKTNEDVNLVYYTYAYSEAEAYKKSYEVLLNHMVRCHTMP